MPSSQAENSAVLPVLPGVSVAPVAARCYRLRSKRSTAAPHDGVRTMKTTKAPDRAVATGIGAAAKPRRTRAAVPWRTTAT